MTDLQFTRNIWLKIRACCAIVRSDQKGERRPRPRKRRGLGFLWGENNDGAPLALVGSASFKPRNRLLAALPHEVLSSLRPHLKPVSLPRGRVLCEADEPLRRIYFVEAGAVSLVTVFEDGTTPEMATVGREGMVGIGALLGGEHALARYVVPVAGFALAMETSRFQGALRESPELRAACEAYAQAFVGHLLQNVACNAAHSVEQWCARWLLTCHDQAEHDTVELTQECLAEMLGVPDSTWTAVVGSLQQAGLIDYRRGAINVLDRLGLEAAACECYRIIRDGYERSLVCASVDAAYETAEGRLMMRLSSKALAETEGLASADTSPWIGGSLSGEGLAPGGTERTTPSRSCEPTLLCVEISATPQFLPLHFPTLLSI